MVLGEPLDLLFSALLRLRAGEVRDGMVELEGTFPADEAHAVDRAMSRAERHIPGDERSRGERDLDRFLIMIDRVMEACTAVTHGRRHATARSRFEKPALPR